MPDLRLHDDDMPEHETWTASHPSPIDRRAENRDQRMTCPPLCHDAGSSIRRLYIYIGQPLLCGASDKLARETSSNRRWRGMLSSPSNPVVFTCHVFDEQEGKNKSRPRVVDNSRGKRKTHTHTENGATLATATSELKTKLAGWAFCRKLKHISLSRKCKRFLCLRARNHSK